MSGFLQSILDGVSREGRHSRRASNQAGVSQLSTYPGQGATNSQPRTYMLDHEIVRLIINDVLSSLRLPVHWLQCERVLEFQESDKDFRRIIVAVRFWSNECMAYLPTIQSRILDRIDTYKPGIDLAQYSLSWEFPDKQRTANTEKPRATGVGSWLSSRSREQGSYHGSSKLAAFADTVPALVEAARDGKL